MEEFNTSQNEITVVFKKYEDLTEFHTDLIKGEGPDIIELSQLDINEYVEKGVLEALEPYMAVSNSLNEGDIIPSLKEMMTRTYYNLPQEYCEHDYPVCISFR